MLSPRPVEHPTRNPQPARRSDVKSLGIGSLGLRSLVLRGSGDRLQPRGTVANEELDQRLRILQLASCVHGAELDDLGAGVGVALAPERGAAVAAEERSDDFAAVSLLAELLGGALDD